MSYAVYATKADLLTFTGIGADGLPGNADALLSKASDLITNSMSEDPLANYVPTEVAALRVEALRLATCAQVEYWLEVGEQDENNAKIQSYSAASVSVTYAQSTGGKKPLCQRARGYLNKQGLLYRGGRLSPRWTERSDEWA